jgi:hypothetical protein
LCCTVSGSGQYEHWEKNEDKGRIRVGLTSIGQVTRFGETWLVDFLAVHVFEFCDRVRRIEICAPRIKKQRLGQGQSAFDR